MKTKFNLKILLLVSILLIAMCLFNTNMVQATDVIADETTTTTDKTQETAPETTTTTTKSINDLTQNDLNTIIPNEIEITTTKTEVANYFCDTTNGDVENPAEIALTEKIISIFSANGYTINSSEFSVTVMTTSWEESFIEIIGKEIHKDFTIKYTKESNYSEQDATYVKNKVDSIKFANYGGMNAVFTMYNLGDEENANKWSKNTFDFTKLLNDSSITIKKSTSLGGQGGGTPWGEYHNLYFYKNNILYAIKYDIANMGAYGITLENGTPVNMIKLEKDDEIYKTMSKELEKNGLKNIIGCYELEAYGTTYKDMKVSFNLGSNYNGKEVKILHKKSDNTYETFTTKVENGKATITVNEFSPFMIALNDTTNTNNNTTNKKLDNEPKTRCSRLYNICKCSCSYFTRWTSNIKIQKIILTYTLEL